MNLQELATRQLDDYDRHRPGSAFAEPDFHLTVEQSYDLQFEIARLRQVRGERLAGYKIGCLSRTIQNQLGLDRPVFGHVWETELYTSGTILHPANFDSLAIEGEFAVRLASDVPSAQWLRNNPEVLATAFVVIELHNYVFRGTSTNRAAELIANNAIHAGVVLPQVETPRHDANTLLDSILRVTRCNELLGEASGRQLEGGPLAGIAHLVEHLERRGHKLQRGEIVLTGSPLPLWHVSGGDQIEVCCAELGTVTCTIDTDGPSTR